jgi:tetratricopeptide (TPR) repeat protein
VRTYLESRLGFDPVEDRVVDAVLATTEGNPLFLSCVADRLVEAGRANLETAAREVPATLGAMIESQLAALDPADRAALEAASLIGVEFSAPLLAAALGADLDATEERLSSLARRQQLVRATGESRWPDGTGAAAFEFRHVLHKSALERGIPPARRRTLHRRVAERLESGWRAQVAAVAAPLALHCDRAGDADRAVRYLHVAGDRATERHAYAAATQYLTRALELLPALADGPERAHRELLLLVSLGTPQLNRRGFGAPEVQATYGRALEICRQVGETPQLFPVLAGLQAFYAVAGDLPRAHQLSRQMLALGDRLGDRAMQLDGHHAMGCDLFRMADLDRAREHLERALSLYDPTRADEAYRWTGHDPRTCCLAHLALTLCYAGAHAQARYRAYEMLEWSEEVRLPFGLAQARMTLGWLHVERGETGVALAHLERALALGTEHDLPYCILMASLLKGRALAEQGDGSAGRRILEEGAALARLMGPHVAEAEYLALSARLAVLAGEAGAGDAVERALALAREREENFLLSDLERLRGEALLMQDAGATARGAAPAEADAEAAFRSAMRIARQQGARARELRAAFELAKLWRRQGRAGEVRELLAPLLDVLCEARDTADFRAAMRLVSALEPAPGAGRASRR